MTSTITPSKTEDAGSPSRLPLIPRSLSSNTIPRRKVRRKDSFVLLSDSTDDAFSPHSSIYDAQYYSASEENTEKPDPVALTVPKSPSIRLIDENVRGGDTRTPSITIPDIEFLYGNGTMLDTITEQKSCQTMRSLARPKSVDHIRKMASLTHSDSFELSKVPRRMQSLSLDDLASIKLSYHNACHNIESKKCSPVPSIHEIYAQPKEPIHAPIVRPSTPPGMPSWTAGQVIGQPQRTATRQRNAIQRFFGLSGPMSIPSSSNPPPPYGSTNRPPPRFRPPRSSYAAIDQHPFTRAPIANTLERANPRLMGRRKAMNRVRFTASATARDSEQNMLRNAIEATSSSAINPITSIPETATVQSPQAACPHRRGRRAAMKSSSRRFNNPFSRSTNTERGGMELPYSTVRQSHLPTQPNIEGSPCHNDVPSARPSLEVSPVVAQGMAGSALSNSSTDHLMSGANPEPRRPHSAKNWCWKCAIDKVVVKLDTFWYNGAACLCFVCCGYDIDEDSHDRNRSDMGVYRLPHAGFRYLDGPCDFENPRTYLAPRQVVLDGTYGVAL
ncbi:hypothetical protein GLAREA_07370 [Glarea lozoyensis ATCC 20868]|uniref:Uncharacterized protein n=1 Tax=Glarea lozoyensis (strain ATCC 20868 / MF5171) TaxID=1116229 RepID=S3D142_GLAL2|nr:uncharacterized protein GLAREA_07370 [Glarea lozoyensis ATCC 20868]EPE32237.1 hypothetical protein GLAREA_07370 [Glarea lozoyensis ATCC 20868]